MVNNWDNCSTYLFYIIVDTKHPASKHPPSIDTNAVQIGLDELGQDTYRVPQEAVDITFGQLE